MHIPEDVPEGSGVPRVPTPVHLKRIVLVCDLLHFVRGVDEAGLWFGFEE